MSSDGSPASARSKSPSSSAASKQRGRNDPAASAAIEQDALETLWRVVYSSTLQWDNRIRIVNTVLSILALLNIGCVAWLFEGCWNPHTLEFRMTSYECDSYDQSLLLCLVLFLLFFFTLIYYYYLKACYKVTTSHFSSPWRAFYHSGLKYGFCIELAISFIQPFPVLYLLIDLSEAQWLILFSLLVRSYLLIRLLRDWSSVYRKRMFIKQFNRQYDTNYYSMDYVTVFKNYAYSYTGSMIIFGTLFNFLLMAYLVHLCEREWWIPQSGSATSNPIPIRYRDIRNPDKMVLWHTTDVSDTRKDVNTVESSLNIFMEYQGVIYEQSPYVSLLNSVYFVGIVATTTGLGDISPVTIQGKLFSVTTAIMGIIWASFLVAVLTNKMALTGFQAYVLDYMTRSRIVYRKEELAAILIQRHWRLHKKFESLARRGRSISPERKREKYMEALGPIIRKFQSVQRQEANLDVEYGNHENKNQQHSHHQREYQHEHQLNHSTLGTIGNVNHPTTLSSLPPSLGGGGMKRSDSSLTLDRRPVFSAAVELRKSGKASAKSSHHFSSEDVEHITSSDQPLVRTSHQSYGSSLASSLPNTPAFSSINPSTSLLSRPNEHMVRIKRSSSDSGKRGGLAVSGMSAKGARKVLTNLGRTQQLQQSHQAAQSMHSLGSRSVSAHHRHLASSSSSYPSATSSSGISLETVSELITTNRLLHSHLSKLESKMDALLQAQSAMSAAAAQAASSSSIITQASNVDNILSTGMKCDRWIINPNSEEEQKGTPIFIWHKQTQDQPTQHHRREDSDDASAYEAASPSSSSAAAPPQEDAKYGILFWTDEEFSVRNNLRIKQPGSELPVHKITEVFSGKGSFDPSLMQALSSTPSTRCFSLISPELNLHISTSSSELRNRWVEQLKRLFVVHNTSASSAPSGRNSPLSRSASRIPADGNISFMHSPRGRDNNA